MNYRIYRLAPITIRILGNWTSLYMPLGSCRKLPERRVIHSGAGEAPYILNFSFLFHLPVSH